MSQNEKREYRHRIVTEPTPFTLEPHGAVQIMAVRTPNGARLEFFEA